MLIHIVQYKYIYPSNVLLVFPSRLWKTGAQLQLSLCKRQGTTQTGHKSITENAFSVNKTHLGFKKCSTKL